MYIRVKKEGAENITTDPVIYAGNHGADAVYIGAPKFGARAAAVNFGV